jgi:hypothetical protein
VQLPVVDQCALQRRHSVDSLDCYTGEDVAMESLVSTENFADEQLVMKDHCSQKKACS